MKLFYNWVIRSDQGLAKVGLKSAVSKGKRRSSKWKIECGFAKI